MPSTSGTGMCDIVVRLKLNYDPTRALAEIQSYVRAAVAQFPTGGQPPSISLGTAGQSVMDLAIDSDRLSPVQVSDYVHRVVGPRLQSVPGVQSVDSTARPTW